MSAMIKHFHNKPNQINFSIIFVGLLFQPIEEFEGASAVLAKCRIENFTSWQELEIAKNSREMVILQSKGIATSNLGSTVAVSSDIQDTYAEIQLTFNTFSCKDEGTYVCSVDRGYHQSANVVVKSMYSILNPEIQ